ncbi:MAG: hypothetical protein GX988_06035 [Clostridiales bacterium]|nr:hypothetical protein [Clostridiales bacterium]
MQNKKKKQSKQNKQKPQKAAMEAANAFVNASSLQNDPLGSYTGTSDSNDEIPEQDADDL